MEASMKNTPALINHVDRLTSQLVTRYLSVLDLARITDKGQPPDGADGDADNDNEVTSQAPDTARTAVNALRIEIETAALIRAAEDLLTLSRQLKELWLFGGLREVRGTGDAEMQGLGGERARQADEDARAVVTAISSLLKGAI